MNESRATIASTPVFAQPKHWKLTADQYQRMGELGIFHEDDRVELLEGELYEMSPIKSWHNATVDRLNWCLTSCLGRRAIVRVQGSFRLSSYSEPEPDILVLSYCGSTPVKAFRKSGSSTARPTGSSSFAIRRTASIARSPLSSATTLSPRWPSPISPSR